MKRIDLILPSLKPFSFEKYLSEKIAEAFEKKGYQTKKVVMEEQKSLEDLREMKENPPHFTLAFSKNLSLQLSQIPHFYWEWKDIAESLHLLKNQNHHLGVRCRNMGQKSGANLHFFPPAASEKTVESSLRPYDVVFFDDLIDPVCLEQSWEELYDPHFVEVLHRVLEKCEKEPSKHPLEIIFAMNLHENVADLLYLIEEYHKAKRIAFLVDQFEGMSVHVFGEHVGNNWLKRLKNSDTIYLHSTLPYLQPYVEYLDILKSSKMIVRDFLPYQDGTDEWVFAAAQSGCLPVTMHTPYLEEEFEIPLPKTHQELKQQVVHFFENEEKRKETLCHMQKIIVQKHTFDVRVEQMLEIVLCG